MVNNEIVNFIQTKIDLILTDLQNSESANYDADFIGFDCVINNEINYQFERAIPKHIVANVLFGSATKQNDIEDKYSMTFVINIQSEVNGGELAKKLFDIFFKDYTRTYQTLGTYSSKIFLASPVLMQPYYEIEDSFACLYTMNGSVEFSERLILGCTYKLSLDGTNFYEVKPLNPRTSKECVGGNDNNYNTPTIMTFSKQSNVLTANITIVYENKTGTGADITNFNNLMNTLYGECFGNSNQSYSLKIQAGTTPAKTITGLLCVRAEHVFDIQTGENGLNIQFKVGE